MIAPNPDRSRWVPRATAGFTGTSADQAAAVDVAGSDAVAGGGRSVRLTM
jgi:hypothetical protein